MAVKAIINKSRTERSVARGRPAMAILTMDDDEKHIRGNLHNFSDLVKTGKEKGLFVFVVTVKNLDLKKKKITGFVHNPKTGGWSPKKLPLPAVIYNRIPNRNDELSPDVQAVVKACLKHPNIRLFNPSFFNKWTLVQWLGKSAKTNEYVPVTRKITNILDLEWLMESFDRVYLKPTSGKAGKGIMKVERVRSDTGTRYLLARQNRRSSRMTVFAKLTGLWENIGKQLLANEYIGQQGIRLVHVNGRPFDLRVLMQKNRRGRWALTGIGARVAGKTSITTHVPRGGMIDDPVKLLETVFGPRKTVRILANVKSAARQIARQIEKKSGHPLGEMSMDLGVDNSGRIWFFEANSRPMKFDEPAIRRRSLERLIDYGLYLNRLGAKESSP